MRSLLFTITAVAFIGCAENLKPVTDTAEELVPEAKVEVDDAGIVYINSSDPEQYVYVEMSTKTEVYPEDPADSTEWDIGFRRFEILTNGGVNGTGGMEGIKVEDQAWDSFTVAPSGEYITDQPAGEEDYYALYVMNDWFDYDGTTHILTPYESFYAIKAVDGQYYKVRVLDYYDEYGTSGHFQLEWETIDSPAGE